MPESATAEDILHPTVADLYAQGGADTTAKSKGTRKKKTTTTQLSAKG